jgi:hypothetical protein
VPARVVVTDRVVHEVAQRLFTGLDVHQVCSNALAGLVERAGECRDLVPSVNRDGLSVV